MMRTHLLVSFAVLVSACAGDDGVHHLADAPDLPIDAPADSPAPDAPDPKVELEITVSGSGSGTVTSSPAGITCTAASCSADFDPDTVVTLTAVPDTGSVFAGWMGACTGTLPTCDVTLAQAQTVTATFDVARYAVTVTKSGTGVGVVAGNGLDCGATCTVMLDHGTMLSLTAAPGALSVFAGWGGACSGAAGCVTTVTGPTAITANFALDDVTLFVTKGGNGGGTVTATGINCGADCSETYTAGQMVTLTAAASTGSTFTGWSGGGCTGTSTCTLTMTAATTVTATFTLQQFALTVTRAGNGAGNVVSTPAGIACGGDCTETYNYNTMVVLTATASTGSTFTGWSGACTGTTPCMVTMTAARSVTATFTLQQFALTVTTSGTGSGTVTSSPAGVACPGDCSQSYNYGTMVTLTAAAATGSTFAGWGGACTGTGACTVTIDAARSVSASFTLNSYTLTVATNGTGMGSVTSAPAGINCGADCTESYTFGTMVTLTAAAATGSTFIGWGGACSGTGACTVTIDSAESVTATFDLQTFSLTAGRLGNGTGTITSAPAGINCPGDCSETYSYGTMVTLTAAPATGSTFTGWSGACTGTGACVVTIDAVETVAATFTLMQFTLTVNRTGNGTVTSSPAGISCGADCNQLYNYGTVVTLTAAPGTGSSFGGWSGGGCSGTGTCVTTVTAATTVNAPFTVNSYLLTVTPAGLGSGTVTSSPAGINCGLDCTESYLHNTMVTLTATANATTSDFGGFSGAGCSTSPCTVTMSQAQTVTATFNLKQLLLRVTKSGDGFGTVTGNGINCGTACTTQTVTVSYGTAVSLTAAPATSSSQLSTFTGWSGGGCMGTGGCTFTITANTTVDAAFRLSPNFMFTTSARYTGNLGGVSGADAKCQQLATARGLSGTYLAYISATGLNAPSRFTTASGWVYVDGSKLINAIGEFGTTTLPKPPLLDEAGSLLTDAGSRPGAWTGTLANTTSAGSSCSTASVPADWTIADNQFRAQAGRCDASDFNVIANGTGGCGILLHLYCFGVDRRATVP
jgi:hypothetical protein